MKETTGLRSFFEFGKLKSIMAEIFESSVHFSSRERMDVYLDTNAISYLDSHPSWDPVVLAAARMRLCELVQSGSVSVFVSYVLLEELLGILPTDRSKYARVMSYLWEIAKTNLLLATNDMGRAEVAKAGRLEGNERLEVWAKTVEVYQECCRERSIRSMPQRTKQEFARFEREENALRDENKEELGTERVGSILHRWWENPESRIDDWVAGFLEKNTARLSLPEDRSKWPPPRAFEAIWRFHAYKMARIYLNVGEGRRIRGSDMFDTHHYVAASYTNVMVSDDRDLRDTCAQIPRQLFMLESFEEFMAKRLSIKKA